MRMAERVGEAVRRAAWDALWRILLSAPRDANAADRAPQPEPIFRREGE
jgi:hypothetical protein